MRTQLRAAAAIVVLLALGIWSGSVTARTAAPLVLPPALRTSGEALDIAVDAARGRAYVPDSRENTLYVFDLATGQPLAHIPTGQQPHHVALLGSRIFVSNFADATLTLIDASTDRVVNTLALGGLGLAVNPETNRLYVAEGSRITVLDAASDAVLGTIAAPAGANVWGLAVDPKADRIYATDIAHPRVLVYDGASYALVGEIAIDAPARFGVTVGVDGRVFVASHTDKSAQLSVIDAAAARVVAQLPIAPFTASLAVHPTTGLLYAASSADRSVTALDPQRPTATAKASFTELAGAVAINPLTGEPLVATTGGAPPQRTLEPGVGR